MSVIILTSTPADTFSTAIQLTQTGIQLINLIGSGGTGDMSAYLLKSQTGQFADLNSLISSGANLFSRDSSISGGLQSNVDAVSTRVIQSGANGLSNYTGVSGALRSTGLALLTKIESTGQVLHDRTSNLDNTADANKPISGPAATALAFKADINRTLRYLSGSNTINLNESCWDYVTGNRAFTFNGSPTGGESIGIYLIVTGASRFISFPASFRVAENATTTGLTLPTGRHDLYWDRYPNEWSLADSVATSDGLPPELHAATHAIGGTDPITITQNQVTNLVSDLSLLAPISGGTLTGTYLAPTASSGTNTNQIATTAFVRSITDTKVTGPITYPCSYGFACSDQSSFISVTGTRLSFRMPHAMTLTGVRAALATGQTAGSTFGVDISENGTSVLSTKLYIDNTEKTSTTAATGFVISDQSLADDAEMGIHVISIGNGSAVGLTVWLNGTRSL